MRRRQRGPVLLHLCHKARGARGGWLFAGWRSQRWGFVAAHLVAGVQQRSGAVEAIVGNRFAEQAGKLAAYLAQFNTVLRALGASQAGGHGAQVQLHDLRVIDLARSGHTEQALRLEVGLEGFDLALGAAGALEVVDGLFIHREKAHGGPVFRRHVADGGAVGQRQGARAFAEELHKLAHHLVLAQDLRHGEHQVGGRHAFAQVACKLKAHHIGREEVHRLAQHGGLGLDAAHTPAHHANAVDHGGVAISAHQGVGVVDTVFALVHAARQIFEVDLVHDAKTRRHHTKGVKGLHAPFHELVALAVALEFELHVQVQRILLAVVVHHDGVVYHQVHRDQRLNLLGVLAQTHRRAAHGGQICQQGHAREILQHHPRHDERNFILAFCVRCPLGQLLHMLCRDLAAIAVAQHRLQNNPNRYGQPCDLRKLLGQRRQRIELAFFARSDWETPQSLGKRVGYRLG